MAESWMYDGFPLKRADNTTRGDDYQFVIQSMDAALRHVFDFSAGVSITPPFSISDDGEVEILQTLSIGSAVAIDEIVDSITLTSEEADDRRLANVASIRTYTSEYIDDYLTAVDAFVLKAGDTMSGALVANGGITASSELDLTNAVFKSSPSLDAGMALLGHGGAELIQYDAAVVVGDSTETLSMTGSGGRPVYKGQSLALVSDISGTIPGMDYVPDAGGTFDGLVNFDSGLAVTSGNSIDLKWNSDASTFSVVKVGTDVTGDVLFASGDDTFDFDGDVQAIAFDLDIGARQSVLQWTGGYIQLGHSSEDVNIVGSSANPLYNGSGLALLSDVFGDIAAGSGITFTGSSPTEISITAGGILYSHLPSGNANEYLRLNAANDELIWDPLDIVAGAGIDVSGTDTITVAIDSLGVDTAQLAADAVTNAKMADDSVDYAELNASRLVTDASAGTYSLIVDADGVGGGTLEWQKGGAAGIVGTIEMLAEYDENSTTSYEEVINEIDGPYVITRIEFTTLASPQTGTIQVIIDGQPAVIEQLLDDTAPVLVGNTEDAMYDFPLFAKESIEVNHKRVGGTGTIRCDVEVVRMA